MQEKSNEQGYPEMLQFQARTRVIDYEFWRSRKPSMQMQSLIRSFLNSGTRTSYDDHLGGMLRSLQKTARIKRTRGFENCLADAGVYLSHQLSFEFNQWSRVLIIVDSTSKLSVNKYITTGIHIGRVGDIVDKSARRRASRPKAQQKRNASNIFCKSCFLFEYRWWV